MLMVRKCSSASVSKASVKGCRREGKIYILRNIDRGDCELLSSITMVRYITRSFFTRCVILVHSGVSRIDFLGFGFEETSVPQ